MDTIILPQNDERLEFRFRVHVKNNMVGYVEVRDIGLHGYQSCSYRVFKSTKNPGEIFTMGKLEYQYNGATKSLGYASKDRKAYINKVLQENIDLILSGTASPSTSSAPSKVVVSADDELLEEQA